MPSPPGSVTPYRESDVLFRVPEYAAQQQNWIRKFEGAQIAPVQGKFGAANDDLMLLPSGHWSLRSWEVDQDFERDVANGNFIIPQNIIDTNLELAPGFEIVPLGGTFTPAGPTDVYHFDQYFARKRVAAASASDYTSRLADDEGTFPKPPYAPAFTYPIDRVGHQPTLLPPNCPAYVRFLGDPATLSPTASIGTFYFGGPISDYGSEGDGGGIYAVNFQGGGVMNLYEYQYKASTWRQVDQRRWVTRAQGPGTSHMVAVIPEDNDALNLIVSSDMYGLPRFGQSRGASGSLYKPKHHITGYHAPKHVTGSGHLRMDLARNLRTPWQFGQLAFRAGDKVLTGAPFQIDFPMVAGTEIRIILDAYLPTDIDAATQPSLDVALFDANTGAALTEAAAGTFTSTASQRYFPKFTFNTGSLVRFSPILRGYWVVIAQTFQLGTETPFGTANSSANILGYSIAGPGVEIEGETAHVAIDDMGDELGQGTPAEGGLQHHNGMRTIIRTTYDPLDQSKRSILFDGILMQQRGRPIGHDGIAWPVPTARQWQCPLAGMYTRLGEPGVSLWRNMDLSQDITVAPDPSNGRRPTPKVTAVIDDLLAAAGFHPSQRNIPDIPSVRVFADASQSMPYLIEPGARPLDLLRYFTEAYFGASLLWEPNAGSLGQWQLLFPPLYDPTGLYTASGGIRWNFVTGGPPDVGGPVRLAHTPDAYPENTSFCTQTDEWVQKPVWNLLIVAAVPLTTGEPNDGKGGTQDAFQQKLAAFAINTRSYRFHPSFPAPNPKSLDHLWHVRPFFHYDPTLTVDFGGPETQRAISLRLYRLFNMFCIGRRWRAWEGELALVDDPALSVKRKLRLYDVVTFNGRPTVITSCGARNELPEGDVYQKADYEGFEVPQPIGYGENLG